MAEQELQPLRSTPLIAEDRLLLPTPTVTSCWEELDEEEKFKTVIIITVFIAGTAMISPLICCPSCALNCWACNCCCCAF